MSETVKRERAPTENRLQRIPPILSVMEPFDKDMLFVMIPYTEIPMPDVLVDKAGELPVVDSKLESFVRMSVLPKTMQDEIRALLTKRGEGDAVSKG